MKFRTTTSVTIYYDRMRKIVFEMLFEYVGHNLGTTTDAVATRIRDAGHCITTYHRDEPAEEPPHEGPYR